MRRGRLERRPSGQDLHEHDAERVKIGAAVDLLSLGQKPEVLGRAVPQLADKDPGLGGHRAGVAVLALGHAEVDDLHGVAAVGAARDHDVLGADVAVHDAGAMDGVESRQRLLHDVHGLARREHAAAADHLRQVFAVDELPHHVMRAVGERGEVVQRGDVRMMDFRGQPRLAQESVVRVAALGDLWADDFDHADRAEVDMLDFVDLAHPARAEALKDPVLAVDGRF